MKLKQYRFATLLTALLTTLGFGSLSHAQNLINTDIPAGINNSGPLNSLHGWHLNIAGFYNRFNNNDTTYASNTIFNSPTVTTTDYYGVDTSNHWGFDAGIGYFYDCLDSSIDFQYFQLYGNDTSSVQGNGVSVIASVSPRNHSASAQAGFGYMTAALTAGHLSRLSPTFDLFYYGGVVYSHYSRNLTVFSPGPAATVAPDSGSSFNGWGPTFGINASTYPLYSLDISSFSISGGVQTSLLYGNLKGYFREWVNNTDLNVIAIPCVKKIVPVLTGDLALNYLFPIGGFSLKTTVGYQATTLFGVSSTPSIDAEANGGFQGFYLNFTGIF